jgi:hypothetical protein
LKEVLVAKKNLLLDDSNTLIYGYFFLLKPRIEEDKFNRNNCKSFIIFLINLILFNSLYRHKQGNLRYNTIKLMNSQTTAKKNQVSKYQTTTTTKEREEEENRS